MSIREDIKKLRELAERFKLPLPLSIVLAEEFAREVGEQVKEAISKVKVRVPTWTTKRIKKLNQLVSGSFTILKERFTNPLSEGRINQILIKSPSKNFELNVFIDGFPVVNESFEALEEKSADYDYITAVEEDSGVYHLSVGELRFNISAHVFIQTYEPITFREIFALYHIKV